MGVIVDGAAGGTGLCRAQVRCATGCAGTAGSGTSTLGARGRSMLEGFYTLGAFVCNLVGRRPYHLSFLLGWGAVGS